MVKKYLLYLIRWQLSTPILAIVISCLSNMNTLIATIIANFIGGLIFFWVDQYIFKKVSKKPLWDIRDEVTCTDCGSIGAGYRIVEWLDYNKSNDEKPEYRCEKCRIEKMKQVKSRLKKKQ